MRALAALRINQASLVVMASGDRVRVRQVATGGAYIFHQKGVAQFLPTMLAGGVNARLENALLESIPPSYRSFLPRKTIVSGAARELGVDVKFPQRLPTGTEEIHAVAVKERWA